MHRQYILRRFLYPTSLLTSTVLPVLGKGLLAGLCGIRTSAFSIDRSEKRARGLQEKNLLDVLLIGEEHDKAARENRNQSGRSSDGREQDLPIDTQSPSSGRRQTVLEGVDLSKSASD